MEDVALELIDFAEFLADEARKISQLYYRSQLGIETKQDKTPVTEADRKIEEIIRKLVANNFPKHEVYGEEFGANQNEAEYVWVVDPIDGTKSFIAGRPLFGSLIALLRNSIPIIGIIDQPILQERWVGVNGVTKLNGRQVRCRGGVKLSDAIFATTSPDMFTENGRFLAEKMASQAAFSIYGGDCYSYGQLAMGLVDVVLESSLKPYDFCALIPIIENAGGKITDWQGNDLTMNSSGDVLACGDPLLHKRILESFF